MTSTPAYSHSPQASLSVGVSPASTLAAAHNNFSYGAEEEELRHKLESSLKKGKSPLPKVLGCHTSETDIVVSSMGVWLFTKLLAFLALKLNYNNGCHQVLLHHVLLPQLQRDSQQEADTVLNQSTVERKGIKLIAVRTP